MKYSFVLFAALFILSFCSCKKQDCHPEDQPSCLENKFEEFKQKPWAESIVKISHPDGDLFWLIDSYADAGEAVLNSNCEVVCTADCECGGDVVFCDGTHLDFPMETIWHQ